ncbi:sugar ABC transporter substrate-binding protein [Halalkalicoccus tibetensis]|uniref:Sugar ABC transporter substrate-binding protein n=1 Tax=Halalkalicoccus tibetensis TaxID=175632 RepID=A0ABD5V7P3_9EURY
MADGSNTPMNRRNILKTAGVAGIASIAGCLGGDDEDNGGPFYPHTIWGMYGSWEEAYVQGGEYYAEDHGFDFENNNSRGEEEEQISHIQNFAQQDADGILVGPVSETAPANQVEQAVSQDIPVIAANSDIDTPDLTMSVYIGNEPACEELGEEIVTYLESDGEAEGTVVNLQGDLGMAIGTEREQGFRNAVDEHDEIEILEISADFNREPAQEGLYSVLQSVDGEVDAIFAANGEMAAGAAGALDTYGMEPGEVFMACMDGSPTVVDLFDSEWLQRAFTQPTQYYLPIAMHYLEVARTEGEDALPDVGDEIDTDDLEITGEEHMGVDIWEGQDWAPATVQEQHDHPWFQTSGRLLTPDNYDESSNWGVIFGQDD